MIEAREGSQSIEEDLEAMKMAEIIISPSGG
jgi:hypothetical protein